MALVLAGVTAAWLGWLHFKAQQRSPISDLPDEILLKIFEHLTPAECHEKRIYAVCRRWSQIVGHANWKAFEFGSPLIRFGAWAPERMLERVRNAASPNESTPAFRRTSGAGCERVRICVHEQRNQGASIALQSLEALAAQAGANLKNVVLVYQGADEPVPGGVECDAFFAAAIECLEKTPVEQLVLEAVGRVAPAYRPNGTPAPDLALLPAVVQLGRSLKSLTLPRTFPLSPANLRALAAACPALTALNVGLSAPAVAQLGALSALARLEALDFVCLSADLRPEHLAQGLEGLAAGPSAATLRRLLPITPAVLDARGAAALARLEALETAVLQVSDAAALRAVAPGRAPRLRTLEVIFKGEGAELLRAAAAVAAGHPALERLDVTSTAGSEAAAAAAEAELARATRACLRSFRAIGTDRAPPGAALCEALAACPRLQAFAIERPYDEADRGALAALARFCELRPPPAAGAARTRLAISVLPGAWREARKLEPLLAGKGELQLQVPFGRPHDCDKQCEKQGTPGYLYHRLIHLEGLAGRPAPQLSDPRRSVLVLQPPPGASGHQLLLRRTERCWMHLAATGRPGEVVWRACAAAGFSAAAMRFSEGELRFLQWLADADPTPPVPTAAAWESLPPAIPSHQNLARLSPAPMAA